MKKILITGGSGFIGTNLVNYLIQKKYNITNVDKLSYASTPEIFRKNKNITYKSELSQATTFLSIQILTVSSICVF